MKKEYQAYIEKEDGSFIPNPELVKCCFCGEIIPEVESNNPWPVCTIDDARCCIKCNWRVVIPARMAKIESPDEYELPKFAVISGDAKEGKSLLNVIAN